MSDTTKDRLVIDPLPGYEPEIGLALAMLEDSRRRSHKVLDGIAAEAVDWTPPDGENSIGTLLYHIAAIEADWLFAEVLEQDFPPEVVALFPHDVRDEQGRLTVVTGLSLDAHLARLRTVRDRVLAAFRGMSLAEFDRPRDLPSYVVTPAWVVQHMMQHEAEHRGQIDLQRARAERAAEGGTD